MQAYPRHAENFVEQATEDTLQGTALRIGCADAREERANLEEAGRRSVAARKAATTRVPDAIVILGHLKVGQPHMKCLKRCSSCI